MGNVNTALTEAVFYILLSLTKPLHGYGIIQTVESWSDGRVKLAPGTLYGAINTLLERNWITAFPEGQNTRKKEYVITDTGFAVLNQEMKRLEELFTNGKQILKETDDERKTDF